MNSDGPPSGRTDLGDFAGLGDLLARLVAHVGLPLPDQLQRQFVQPILIWFCVVLGRGGVGVRFRNDQRGPPGKGKAIM